MDPQALAALTGVSADTGLDRVQHHLGGRGGGRIGGQRYCCRRGSRAGQQLAWLTGTRLCRPIYNGLTTPWAVTGWPQPVNVVAAIEAARRGKSVRRLAMVARLTLVAAGLAGRRRRERPGHRL